MSAAREEILGRLRAALADVPGDEAVDDVAVDRGYRHAGTASAARRADLLAERVADYRATVHRCTKRELPDTVTRILSDAGVESLAVPHDIPHAWYAGFAGTVRADSAADPLPLDTLDTVDAVLTGCAAAVAATGTLVLDGGPAQGRRALTLVPDHHVCVVTPDVVAEILPEALSRLDPTRPLTFVSGPSATSDIEFNRIEGVHGPRRLDVVLVSSRAAPRRRAPRGTTAGSGQDSPSSTRR